MTKQTNRAQRRTKLERWKRTVLAKCPDEFGIVASAQINATGKVKTFTMRAYDGGKLLVDAAPVPVVVDLAGMQVAPQVKALLQHSPTRPVGHINADQIQIGADIQASGVFSVPGDDLNTVLDAHGNGYQWEASIGARIQQPLHENIEAVAPGRVATVNGQTVTGPCIIARKSLLHEISFVGQGGGANTSVRIAAARQVSTTVVPADTSTDPEDLQMKPEELKAAIGEAVTGAVTELKTEFNQQLSELQASHRKQVNELQASARVDSAASKYGLKDIQQLEEIKAKAGTESWDEKDIELAVLRASRNSNPTGFQPLAGKDGAPMLQPTITAALGRALCGWDENFIGESFGDKVSDELTAKRWNSWGLKASMVEFLKAHGRDVFGGDITNEDIRAALDITASGTVSTYNLPVALGDVADKELLRSFSEIEPQLRAIAYRTSNATYNPKHLFRVSLSKGFEEIGNDGQYPSATLIESSYQTRVRPYGTKLCIGAADWNSDDAGAFRTMLVEFAAEAAHAIEFALAKAIIDGIGTFWTAQKGNYITGAGSRLDFDNLALAETALDTFRTEDADGNVGRMRNVEGTHIAAAPGASFQAARQFYKSAKLGFLSTEQQGTDNPYEEKYLPVKAKYFADSAGTGAAGTEWMMCANPALTSPVALAGHRTTNPMPKTTFWERLPGSNGVQWDVELPFGTSLHDDKAGVLASGTPDA